MRLLLADDHTLFRDALTLYLNRLRSSADMALAKDYHEVQEIMDKSTDFDLVILDLCMPGMNGFDGLKDFVKKWPQTPVAIISGVADKWEVEESLRLGARGFFPKTLSGKALVQAIELIIAGEKFQPVNYTPPPPHNTSQHTHITDESGKTLKRDDVKLTPREKDVLEYLVQGLSNQQIADKMDLQVVTIKLHIRGICRKLSAQNRTQAALRAQELQLIDT